MMRRCPNNIGLAVRVEESRRFAPPAEVSVQRSPSSRRTQRR
jgi:hypothetical protein